MGMTWPVFRLCSANMKALRETWQLWETRWDAEEENLKAFFLSTRNDWTIAVLSVFIVFIPLSLILGEFSWWNCPASDPVTSRICWRSPRKMHRVESGLEQSGKTCWPAQREAWRLSWPAAFPQWLQVVMLCPLSICLLLVKYTWHFVPHDYFCEGFRKGLFSMLWPISVEGEGKIPYYCVFTGTSCLGSMGSGAWSPQMNSQRMWLELKLYWKGTRYVKDKCFVNMSKCFFPDPFQLEFQALVIEQHISAPCRSTAQKLMQELALSRHLNSLDNNF